MKSSTNPPVKKRKWIDEFNFMEWNLFEGSNLHMGKILIPIMNF